MKNVKIKDLYAGRPDAKDEIYFDGTDSFIKTFVVAEHFNLDLLTKGNHCFITGFKGTGKTALLFYLDNKLKIEDPATCSSFVFFKEDFADARRDGLHEISRRVLSSIMIEPGALTEATEFEYVWRWIFFKQIVNDNEYYSRNLFVDDEYWHKFENTVTRIKDPLEKRKIIIPDKIKFSATLEDPASQTKVEPEIEVDFQNPSSEQYREFISLINEAENAFLEVTKTDIPYYIFVDELEAYYGDQKIFTRDLCMIRDLIFTVKRFNTFLQEQICAARRFFVQFVVKY